MPPALAQKRIAGYIVAEPFNAAAETLGVGKVLRFTGDVWRNHACCVVFMHERDLEQRPQWSQKVVDAIVQASSGSATTARKPPGCCPRKASTATRRTACRP